MKSICTFGLYSELCLNDEPLSLCISMWRKIWRLHDTTAIHHGKLWHSGDWNKNILLKTPEAHIEMCLNCSLDMNKGWINTMKRTSIQPQSVHFDCSDLCLKDEWLSIKVFTFRNKYGRELTSVKAWTKTLLCAVSHSTGQSYYHRICFDGNYPFLGNKGRQWERVKYGNGTQLGLGWARLYWVYEPVG